MIKFTEYEIILHVTLLKLLKKHTFYNRSKLFNLYEEVSDDTPGISQISTYVNTIENFKN